MGILQNVAKFLGRDSETKEKFKEMQEDDRLQTMLEERKKSSNRRELEKYYRDKEEAEIKRQLDIIRKQRNRESWTGNDILKQNFDILKSSNGSCGCTILKDNKKLFSSKAKIGGCMFFK